MSIIVLDSLEGITFNTESPQLENSHSIFCLKDGLSFLAQQVRQIELDLYRPNQLFFSWKSDDPNRSLLVNYFDWFTINLINYLRLLKLLHLTTLNEWDIRSLSDETIKKDIKTQATKYVREIVPEIYIWRNKVSAHPCITSPYREDNIATMQISISGLINYDSPYYYCGGLILNIDGNDSDLPCWSLTKTYEDLTERFWPDQRIRSF